MPVPVTLTIEDHWLRSNNHFLSAFYPQVLAATGAVPGSLVAAQTQGQVCEQCGDLGHFQQECQEDAMEVQQVYSLTGMSTPNSGRGGMYSVLVRCQGIVR